MYSVLRNSEDFANRISGGVGGGRLQIIYSNLFYSYTLFIPLHHFVVSPSTCAYSLRSCYIIILPNTYFEEIYVESMFLRRCCLWRCILRRCILRRCPFDPITRGLAPRGLVQSGRMVTGHTAPQRVTALRQALLIGPSS